MYKNSFKAYNEEELYKSSYQISWNDYLSVDQTFSISSIVYSTHFIWFYHVCWGFDGYRNNSKDTGYFELFILTDALLSCFNLHVFQFLILEHNKILKKLNYEDNCTIIIEPNIVNVIV